MASSSSSPCAACKFLRRKCTSECVFAPYFPPDQPQKFANVHKIFGASNITKLLNDLPPQQREDAVNSLAYEADARVKDPVYGCVGAISVLQRQVAQLQQDLRIAHADLARYAGGMAGVNVNVTQGMPSSSLGPLGIGMNLGVSTRDQILSQEHVHEMVRGEPHLSREQVIEIARVGGGSFEAGLAALGISVGSLGSHSGGGGFPSRSLSDGGNGGGMGGKMSPP